MIDSRAPDIAADRMREAIRQVIQETGIPLATWCAKAGISEGSPRGFLKGRTKAIHSDNLLKMADAINYPVSRILGEPQRKMRVDGFVKDGGRIWVAPDEVSMPDADQPPEMSDRILAFRVTGMGNLPELSDGDTIYIRDEWLPVTSLFGFRCIVRLPDTEMFIGRLQAGSKPGVVTLQPINAAPQIDIAPLATPILWTSHARPTA